MKLLFIMDEYWYIKFPWQPPVLYLVKAYSLILEIKHINWCPIMYFRYILPAKHTNRKYSDVLFHWFVCYIWKSQICHCLLQVGKRIRTDGPQALLKKVDLDHLLDFVHGEIPGWSWHLRVDNNGHWHVRKNSFVVFICASIFLLCNSTFSLLCTFCMKCFAW